MQNIKRISSNMIIPMHQSKDWNTKKEVAKLKNQKEDWKTKKGCISLKI